MEQLAQGFARAKAGGHILRARAEAGAPVEVLQLQGAVHVFSDVRNRPGFNSGVGAASGTVMLSAVEASLPRK
ncbi:hypothetical protein GCM10022409_23410 [Hymenobacter glaciei]|uniref:Uncharacterized protein n=1 Tax=Hymenobacter glaciei TaxID=877209 RepID=A0ABP7U7Y9_9BACT